MGLTVLSRPSSYSALGNPTIYKIQRKDFLVTSVDNSSGLARLNISGDVTASFSVDDKIFVGVAGYMALAEVVNRNTSGGNTTIVTTLLYVGGGSGYVNNLTTKLLHHILVLFYDGQNDVPLFNGLEFRFATDDTGLGIVDAQVLRYLFVENLITRNFTTGGYVYEDDQRHKQFYISYQEKWSDSGGSVVVDSGNKFIGYLSALQLPGTNDLSSYVIGSASTPPFPSAFQKFTAWKGYPFSFSVMATMAALTYNLYIDGASVASGGGTATPTKRISLNQVVQNVGLHTLQLRNGTTTVISEIDFEVKDIDCVSPVMLVGRDALGCPVHWLFEGNQQLEITNDEGYKFIKMTCAAPGLSVDEFTALHQAFAPASIVVDTDYRDMSTTYGTRRHDNKDIFTLSKDGTVKTQVTCDSFKAIRDTKSDNGNFFEVTILLPFDQDL